MSDICDCCAGTGKHASGLPCICGGTGNGSDEKAGLRKEIQCLKEELETCRRERDEAQEQLSTLCFQRDYAEFGEAYIELGLQIAEAERDKLKEVLEKIAKKDSKGRAADPWSAYIAQQCLNGIVSKE